MNPPTGPTRHDLDDRDLERLLRLRHASLDPSDVLCGELDLVSAAIAGELADPERGRQLEHARRCSTCRLAIEASGDLHRLRRRLKLQVAAAGSVALALAASLLLLMRPPLVSLSEPERPQLTAKGAQPPDLILVEVGVRRGTTEGVVEPGDHLQTGDLVGFLYTAARPVHLAVAYVDAERETTWLYPSGGASPPLLPAAARTALPGAGQLSEASGCAWFVTVWSDGPFALDSVEHAIRQARTDSKCSLDIDSPGPIETALLSVYRGP
ncbi:MAG: hypothetical protein ACI9WU_003324 [Myxococcota bacterium]|jgi:hypothetical protein